MGYTTDGGGPAFPMDHDHGSWRDQWPGMTLRDYFAGQALAGLCANHNTTPFTANDALVAAAWAAADRMLALRNE